MKIYKLLVLAFLLTSCSGASVRSTFKKTAQVNRNFTLGIASSNNLSDAIGVELLKYDFNIVERARIQSIFQELKLNTTGVLSPENLKKVGKISSVDYLVFVKTERDIQNRNAIGTASLRVIDVETGLLLGGVNYQNNNFSKSKVGKVPKRESLPKIAQRMAKSFYKSIKKIIH